MGRDMMRLATKAGRTTPMAVRRSRPPQETLLVACHSEWSSRPPPKKALTEARSSPSESSQQVVVQDVSTDAHAVHKLGHIGTLSGEHNFSWGVTNARGGRTHFVAGAHRLPGACVVLLARANQGGPRRGGARVLAEDRDCGVSQPRNSRVPSRGQRSRQELFALPHTAQPRVAPNVARAASRARSHPSNAHGLKKTCPSSTNHSSQTPLCSKGEEW